MPSGGEAWSAWFSSVPDVPCPHSEASHLIGSVDLSHRARAVECLLLLGARWAWLQASARPDGQVDLQALAKSLHAPDSNRNCKSAAGKRALDGFSEVCILLWSHGVMNLDGSQVHCDPSVR
jgi:hypothetical protein